MLTSKPRLPVMELLLVGMLPSPIKKIFYRLKGYKIGRNVSLGLGCLITGDQVEIGDGTQVGLLTLVSGRSIKLGRHVQIGMLSYVAVPIIEIGEGSKINEHVYVGGLQFPDSELIMGRNCQIMQFSVINPTRSIRIGDDSGIGGYCLVFGHSSWLSKFEGYPVDFDSIEIGRSVSVAWRVFILPGTKIGDGAMIGANSLVRGAIPDHCLAMGFPARVVSKPPELPRLVSDEEKVRILGEITLEMIEYFRGFNLGCSEQDGAWVVTYPVKRWLGSSRRRESVRVSIAHGEALAAELARQPANVVLSLFNIPPETRRRLDAAQCVWLDIENKERSDHGSEVGEEVALFLRRYGVRLDRQPRA